MNREQSIVSAIVTFIMVVVAPFLQARGIILDQGLVTTVIVAVLMIGGFVWAFYKNHNFTEASQWAQSFLNDYKKGICDDPEDDEEVE